MVDDFKLRMQYVGACALLARLSGAHRNEPEELETIAQCLNDCANTLGGFEVVRTSDGGYSLEPVSRAA